jgi:hypothetical protein
MLNEPEIITSLLKEQENNEFWKTVDLKALVNWRIQHNE